MQRPVAPLTRVTLAVRSGAASDGPLTGVSLLTAHAMVTGGAGQFGATELVERLGSTGARVEVDSTLDATYWSLGVPPDRLALALSLFAEMVRRPRFTYPLFVRTRERLMVQARELARHSGYWPAREVIFQRLFAAEGEDAAYTRTGATRKELSEIAVPQCRRWHAHHVTPQNAVVSVVGTVDPPAALELVVDSFGDWKGSPPPTTTPVAPPTVRGPQFALVNQPDATRAQVVAGWIGPAGPSPQRSAFEVGLRSLCSDPRLTESTPSGTRLTHCDFVSLAGGASVALLGVETIPGNLGRVTARLLATIESADDSRPLIETELHRMVTSRPTAWESNRGLSRKLCELAVLGLSLDAPNEELDRLRALDTDAVERAREDWLSRDRVVLGAAGPAKEVDPALSRLLSVEVVSAEDFRVLRRLPTPND